MYLHVIHDGYSFYLIDQSGELRWYRDSAGDGANSWQVNSGKQIGTGWNNVWKMFAGSDFGEFYVVDRNGNLRWYQDLLRDGSNNPGGNSGWDHASGKIVGTGWDGVPHIFPGPNGVIYVVNYAGELLWYQRWKEPRLVGSTTVGGDPYSLWANRGVGQRIGVGWLEGRTIVTSKFAAPPQSTNSYVIYIVRDDGGLYWYQDTKSDGTSRPDCYGWAENSGRQVGRGWKAPLLLAGSGGILYLGHVDGTLHFYRDLLRDGTSDGGGYGWATNSGAQIGTEWVQFDPGAGPSPPEPGDGDGGGGNVDTPNPVGNSQDDPTD